MKQIPPDSDRVSSGWRQGLPVTRTRTGPGRRAHHTDAGLDPGSGRQCPSGAARSERAAIMMVPVWHLRTMGLTTLRLGLKVPTRTAGGVGRPGSARIVGS
jgi:hypothetical protein